MEGLRGAARQNIRAINHNGSKLFLGHAHAGLAEMT